MPSIAAKLSLAVLGLVWIVPAASAAKIERVVSPGGIVAWLVEDYSVPVVSMNFAFHGGAVQDPAGKPGVANMLSGLLDEGAGNMDSQAFQSELDSLSIGLDFDAGRDDFFGTIKTLTENQDAAFNMLALAIQSPRFDAEPVERIRAQVETRIQRSADDPDTIATEAMCGAAFAGHPYGQPLDGTVDSVSKITTGDLSTYRQNIFARDNLKIAVVGAVDAKTVGRLVDEVFGPLPQTAALKAVPSIAPKAGDIHISMPNPQTLIRFGGPGIARSDPDFMPAYVVNHILGGGTFSSRLYSEVREKRGLAYTISTTLVSMEHATALVGSTATRADRADETVALIEAETARLAKDGPTEAELAKAKSFLIGSYALRFDSSSKIARQILGIQLDGLPIDYVEKRNSIIAAVTLEDAKRAAKRLFSTGTNMVVRVGPEAPRLAEQSTPTDIPLAVRRL
jgi:zinc protease